jgi:hypothetical protein
MPSYGNYQTLDSRIADLEKLAGRSLSDFAALAEEVLGSQEYQQMLDQGFSSQTQIIGYIKARYNTATVASPITTQREAMRTGKDAAAGQD